MASGLAEFDCTLNIEDSTALCKEGAPAALRLLADKYEGRGLGGYLILRVVRVTREGPCRFVRGTPGAAMTIDLSFEAAVVAFARWDILVGVDVCQVAQLILGRYTFGALRARGIDTGAVPPDETAAIVAIRSSPADAALKVGARVPVRVLLVSCPVGHAFTCVADVLICDQAAPAYAVRGPLRGDAHLAALVARAEKELALRGAADPGELAFFEELLLSRPPPAKAPLLSAPAWAGGPIWEGVGAPAPGAVSILDLVREACRAGAVDASGVWSRPLEYPRSSPLALRSPLPSAAGAAGAAGAPIEGAATSVFDLFLSQMVAFLEAGRLLAAEYPPPRREEYAPLWAAMRKARPP